MGVLDEILTRKRNELVELRRRVLPPFPRRVVPVDLRRKPDGSLRILAENKKRSPSAGALSTVLGVAERAAAYERAGASMISVLCDSHFFGGDYEDLIRAREGSSLPLLCKEFIVDESQLDCALAYGASAALLIVRCLSDEALDRLLPATIARGLLPIVEVATEAEAELALRAGATTIGVNARDLDTLEMKPERAAAILRGLPNHITKLHLSGLAKPEDVKQVFDGPADAALVGEILMRQDDPEPLLRSLVAAATVGSV
jgi:indole-3-glycerol phosphate synthase